MQLPKVYTTPVKSIIKSFHDWSFDYRTTIEETRDDLKAIDKKMNQLLDENKRINAQLQALSAKKEMLIHGVR